MNPLPHSQPAPPPPHSHSQPNPHPHLDLLYDLIQSEKSYTNNLLTIINRIAAAYSPTNLPPAHLDHHFRLIESIFRAHKLFLSQSIAPVDPPHPNFHLISLVNLLLNLLHHLLPVYHRYCHPNGWAARSYWSRDHQVNSNPRLIEILDSLEWPESCPIPSQSQSIFPDAPYPIEELITLRSLRSNQKKPHATLTVYFALPFVRLIYYKRFFHSILNLLQHGRPEHKSIYDSCHQLSLLLDRGRAQWNPRPPLSQARPSLDPTIPHHQQHQMPIQSQAGPQRSPASDPSPVQALQPQLSNSKPPGSSTSLRASLETNLSGLANRSSGGSTTETVSEVFDRTTPSTPLSSASTTFDVQPQTTSKLSQDMVQVTPGVFIQQALLDLQSRLDPSRCVDIFTMAPKQCRLHLAPPSLAFSRSIRHISDAKFKPRVQPNQASQLQITSGQLILITDLLMFCEPKDPSSPKTTSMWLMFPPLAGKHLQVLPVIDEPEFAFDIYAMGKELIRVYVGSLVERDTCMKHLNEAIEFGRQTVVHKQVDSIPENSKPTSRDRLSLESLKLPPLSNLSINLVPPRPVAQSHPISPSLSQHSSGQASQFSPPAHAEFSKESSITAHFAGQYATQRAPYSPATTDPAVSDYDGDSFFKPDSNNSDSAGPRQSLRSAGSETDGQRRQSGPALSPNDHRDSFFGPDPNNYYSVPDTPANAGPRSAESNAGGQRRQSGPGLLSPMAQYSSHAASHSVRPLRKAPSAHALGAYHDQRSANCPPMPMPVPMKVAHSLGPTGDSRFGGAIPQLIDPNSIQRPTSTDPYRERTFRPPSAMTSDLQNHQRQSGGTFVSQDRPIHLSRRGSDEDISPPQSPTELQSGPSILAATMKTKVFLKQSHSQWKALGAAKLSVFIQKPANVKQLVVADSKGKTLISTIVLTDGVERVGRTGVAVYLSDRGVRTGIVYMLQMKNETSASGLFEQLLEGSDRRPK